MIHKRYRNPTRQSRMNNPDTRDTCHTRHRIDTNKTKKQKQKQKTQTQNTKQHRKQKRGVSK